jgi:hypothetical protein
MLARGQDLLVWFQLTDYPLSANLQAVIFRQLFQMMNFMVYPKFFYCVVISPNIGLEWRWSRWRIYSFNEITDEWDYGVTSWYLNFQYLVCLFTLWFIEMGHNFIFVGQFISNLIFSLIFLYSNLLRMQEKNTMVRIHRRIFLSDLKQAAPHTGV